MPDRDVRFVAQRWGLMRLLLMAVVAMLMFALHGSMAKAENNCVSGELCAWTGTFYTGSEAYLSCPGGTGVEIFIPEMKSAKNRCSGQYIRIGWAEGGFTNWKACMVPGGERPEPGRFNRYERVGGC
jgi:Peptidase inhibitor family I36